MNSKHFVNPLKGAHLKQMRHTIGLTQAQVARHIGVTPATISHWEIGLCFPPPWRLIKLAELYHVSVEELLSESELKSIKL